MQRKNKQIVRW